MFFLSTKNNTPLLHTLFIVLCACCFTPLCAQSTMADYFIKKIDYYYHYNLQEARIYSDSALNATDTAQWTAAQKTALLLQISRLDYADGEYTQAIRSATQASHFAYELKDTTLLINCYLQFGDIYIEKGYLDKSVEYQRKAANLLENRGLPNTLAYAYMGLGRSYFSLRQWDDANNYFDKAIAAAEQHDQKHDTSLLVQLYLDKGRTYNIKEQFIEASDWFNKALSLAQKSANKRLLALSLRAFGALHLRQQRFDSAQICYTQASQHFLEINDQLQRARTLQGLGEVATDMQNYPVAVEQLERAMLIARTIRAKILARDIYADLYRVYLQQEDYQQALLHFRKFTSIKDSIASQERTERIAEIEVKYETEKLAREKLELAERNRNQAYDLQLKQQEIDLQQFSNRQKYWIILLLLGGILLLAIIALLVIRQNRLKAKVRENELQEQALKAQMNPHFIFNSLNSIQSLIATNDNAGASIYLARFAKLMRMILNNSRRSFLSLREEIDFLNLYVELENRRFQQAFTYNISCDEELEGEAAWIQIPTFVVQPFIENAIAHGLLKKSGGGQLTVRFDWVSDTQLRCVVQDNGIGRQAAAQTATDTSKTHESLGINITEQRLRRLLGLSASAPAPLIISDLSDPLTNTALGTKVEILLPIKKMQD